MIRLDATNPVHAAELKEVTEHFNSTAVPMEYLEDYFSSCTITAVHRIQVTPARCHTLRSHVDRPRQICTDLHAMLVFRVQNLATYLQYESAKLKLLQSNPNATIDLRVYHGCGSSTHDDPIASIVQDGFDVAYGECCPGSVVTRARATASVACDGDDGMLTARSLLCFDLPVVICGSPRTAVTVHRVDSRTSVGEASDRSSKSRSRHCRMRTRTYAQADRVAASSRVA
jgi:hypothetical protein